LFKDGYLELLKEWTIAKVVADLKENFTDEAQT